LSLGECDRHAGMMRLRHQTFQSAPVPPRSASR
jgi:hypothetical protein